MRVFRTVLEQKIRERRQTFEEFAEFAETFAREHQDLQLGTVSVRHLQRLASGVGPKGRPLGPVRPATARLLEEILGGSIEELLSPPGVPVELGMSDKQSGAFDWLDARLGWLPESSRWEVSSRLASADEARDRQTRRARVDRSRLARALWEYYAEPVQGYGAFGARCGDDELVTSILTRGDWLDLATPLGLENERFSLAGAPHAGGEVDAKLAVDRLAEAAALDVRMADLPIYRMLL
jgi:hypothetical protein